MSEESTDDDTTNTEASADTAPAEQPDQEPAESQPEAPDTGTDWKAEADKWKAMARKHENRHLDALGLQPGELDTLRQQSTELDSLREQVTSRDSQITTAQQSLAAERLHTRLARAGVPTEDATAVIEHIDPSRLMEDGTPSESAIDAVAASLSRSVARGVDEDQGQSSPGPAVSADQWLRQKARK